MLLKDCVRMMEHASKCGKWGDLHPDLDAINIYFAGSMTVEAPALEDRNSILRAVLTDLDHDDAIQSELLVPEQFLYCDPWGWHIFEASIFS